MNFSDVGEVSQFSLFHGNDKKSNLDYNKVTGSFMTRVKTGYLQNLKSTQSSSIVNDASRETLMDVVKNDEDDEVVEKIVDNPQTTTIRSDIGVNQGEDDQQQYRHITDDTEQFMAEENDANKELYLNDLDSNHETLKKDKLDDKTNETEMEDIKENAAVSYGDNLTFYTGPGDVVYDIIYDYHQPEIMEEEYQQSLDEGLILSTLESHNQVIGNTIEDENIDLGDSFNYKEPIEPLDYPDYQDTQKTDEEYYNFEPVDADQRRLREPVLEDNIYSQSRKSSSLVQDSEELFKIPFIMDFDAFGSETFSNARLRIPEQFQKLIHQPWTRGHAW